MTIIELRNKRAKALEAAKAFLESHRGEDGCLSAEDDATYTSMEATIAKLGAEIGRMERMEAIDAELAKPVATPITEKPATAKVETKTAVYQLRQNCKQCKCSRHNHSAPLILLHGRDDKGCRYKKEINI